MNALQKCWYRTFQVCFKAVSGLLPWRKPEILEGEGSIFKVGEIIKQKGLKKAMIVTGPNISKTNMLDNLYKGLSDNGIEYVVFNKPCRIRPSTSSKTLWPNTKQTVASASWLWAAALPWTAQKQWARALQGLKTCSEA